MVTELNISPILRLLHVYLVKSKEIREFGIWKIFGKCQTRLFFGSQGNIRHTHSDNELLLKPLRCVIDEPPDLLEAPISSSSAVHNFLITVPRFA